MNFEFSEAVNPHLKRGHFAEAVRIAESSLSALPASPFHTIIGRPLLNQADRLCSWIDEFYTAVGGNHPIAALYFELTEFDINTDVWCIDGFAYTQDEGLDDLEWLSEPSAGHTADLPFIVTGYEALQQAFEEVESDSDELQDAQDWSEQLVIIRYMELIHAAHKLAQQKELAWSRLPLYCTEHGYDFVTMSTNNQ